MLACTADAARPAFPEQVREIAPFADEREPQVLPVKDVAWLARILWVSQ